MNRKLIKSVDVMPSGKYTCDFCKQSQGFLHYIEDGYMDVYECANCGTIHYW